MNTDTNPELDELLGAYALDALEGDERDRVARYLEANAVARREVDELRETAATLALAPLEHELAPPELWDRIAGAINAGAQSEAQNEADVVALATRRRSVPLRVAAPLAAVAAALIGVLAVANASDGGRVEGYDEAFSAVARSGRSLTLEGRGRADVALADGKGWLRVTDLPDLADGQVYQAWAVYPDTGSPISIGVLSAEYTSFEYDSDLEAIAITIEDSPGVVVSRSEPVAAGAV